MSHNTWLHRSVRGAISRFAPAWLAPNHLTTARLLTGLAASACFVSTSASMHISGALLFVLSMLLDRADGELARQSGKLSAWGHRYDLITDATCNAAVFTGIGIGAQSGRWLHLAPVMGIIAGLAIVVVLFLVIRLEQRQGDGAASFEANAGFDPDDAMLAVPLAMLLGLGDWLLVAAAVGAPLAAVVVFVIFRRARGPKDWSEPR